MINWLGFVYFLFAGMILISCNNVTSQKRAYADLVASDSELVQEDSSDSKGFYNIIKRGEYHSRSLDEKFLELSENKIGIESVKDTALLNDNHYMYLANDRPIVLFSVMYPKGKQDIAGVLEQGSFVSVDTVFYNNIYINSDKAPMSFGKWYSLLSDESLEFDKPPLTYDVWYIIGINGERYYTDCKLHNYIEYKKYLPTKKQLLLICSQGTGYDGGYDNGYPESYRVVVLQEPQLADEAWKQIYCSPDLDLNNGGVDEYGLSELFIEYLTEEDYVSPVLIDANGNLVITYENCWELTWNGTDLSIDWDDNYLNREN